MTDYPGFTYHSVEVPAYYVQRRKIGEGDWDYYTHDACGQKAIEIKKWHDPSSDWRMPYSYTTGLRCESCGAEAGDLSGGWDG
jgi:hypothetical protein